MLLTTNPGYIDSNAYAGDPASNPVPDAFHNDYQNGVTSYSLANLAAGAPPFSQDIAGIVNGPTAADIAAGRIIDANNVWIDPPAGGLNGSNLTQTGVDSNAGGGSAVASGDRSLAVGAATVASGTDSVALGSGTTATAAAAFSFGRSVDLGNIIAQGVGALAGGDNFTTGSGSLIDAAGPGCVALGAIQTGSGDIRADGFGSLAMGLTVTGNNVTADGFSNLAFGYADTGAIEAIVTSGNCVQFGPGTNTTSKSIQFGSNFAFNYGANTMALFGGPAAGQQSGTGETVGFTAGVGTGVNDDSTFTGNVGATAYNLNDIVKALKNLNLLAT